MDVIPHDELREREDAKHRILDNLPLLLLFDSFTHQMEHQTHVYSMGIPRQRIDTFHFYFILLFEHLHQRNIEHHLFITLTNGVGTLFHGDNLNRY